MGFEEFEPWLELSTDLSEKSIRGYIAAMWQISVDHKESDDEAIDWGVANDLASV